MSFTAIFLSIGYGRNKAGVTRATKLLQLATKSDFNAC